MFDSIESTRYLYEGHQAGEQYSKSGRTKTTKAFVRQVISLETTSSNETDALI